MKHSYRTHQQFSRTNGYEVTRKLKDHPLAMRDGRIFKHRAVLFDSIGYGPHRCTICGTHINWNAATFKMRLVVDHIDNDRMNNTIGNLRAVCDSCNLWLGWSTRGYQRAQPNRCDTQQAA